MKIVSVILLAIWALIAVKPAAANLFVMPPAHREGPHHMINDRWGWKISYGPHGSVVLQTGDSGHSWQDKTPPGFDRSAPDLNDSDTFVSRFGLYANNDAFASSFGLSALDSQRCWIAFDSRISSKIIVEQTSDGGRHWKSRVIDGKSNTLVLNFVDPRHGFLLALGDPAAGLMAKRVYQTSDGSRTWHLVSSEIASNTAFYPAGMAFRDHLNGWVAATYHGTPDVPLYRSRDGGKTWHLQLLPEPNFLQNGGYGNTDPPQFFGPHKRDGSLVVNYNSSTINRFETITYLTRDGGETWQVGQRRRTKSASRNNR